MRTARRRRFRDLAMGLAALIGAVLAVVVVVWVNIDTLEAADRGNAEAREELAAGETVRDAISDQMNALDGLTETRDPRYIAPSQEGRLRLDAALGHLRDHAANGPAIQRRNVAKIDHLARRWVSIVADPNIAAIRARHILPPKSEEGAKVMAEMQTLIDQLCAAEIQHLQARQQEQAVAYGITRVALVAGGLAALVVAILILGRTARQLINERRLAEAAAAQLKEALEHARAAEVAKTRFLANMSHEMRTPLNGVAGMIDALGRTPLDARQLEFVDAIRFSSVTLDQLIGDLLSVSRDGEKPVADRVAKPFHLGSAVRVAAEPFAIRARTKGLDFALEIAPDAEVGVVGDAQKLVQLLACLLSNAVKFSHQGEVRLRVLGLAEGRFAFEVADTGIGFDDAGKAEMFETFRQSDDSDTRRYGGAGLGLALALRLADELGGVLDAHSTPDVGSTFGFEIEFGVMDSGACSEGPATAPTRSAEAVAERESETRILIVDDNPTNRKLLELILDQLEIEWVSVADGLQAVEAVAAQAFAAILMDIQMPVMDGLTATREIRRLEREGGRAAAPVIIVSANCQPEHVDAGLAAGAQRHLSKPVNVQGLIDALNDVLADHQQAA